MIRCFECENYTPYKSRYGGKCSIKFKGKILKVSPVDYCDKAEEKVISEE